MRHRRLTWVLVLRQVAAVVAVVLTVAVILVGWWDPPPTDLHRWWPNAQRILAEAVQRGPDGRLVIAETPGLTAYRAANPALAVAVIDRASGEVAAGSSVPLVEAVRGADAALPIEAWWRLAGGITGASTRTIPAGEVTFLIAGAELQAEDRLRFAWGILRDILNYLVPACLVMGLVCWLVVRRVLRPLTGAAAEVAALDFRNAGARLPEDARVPRELLPLVQGINRALDRLQEGFERQRRFTANAAHEIRTPVAVLLARLESPEPAVSRVALKRDAERIALLVEQMLAIARLEQRTEAMAPLDLAALAAEVASDFAPLAADRGRGIGFDRPDGPVMVPGAASALRSAIGNLIDNALWVEPAGGTVEVAVGAEGCIRVADHGPGVPPEARERLFEPFWRGGAARPGSGLGLAIVRDIVAMHDGSLRVEETAGGGATFVLCLPPLPAPGAAGRTEPRP